MPVASGPQINPRSAVLVGVSGVVAALVIGAMVIWASSSSGDVQIQLGDTDFNAGNIHSISDEIADRGPILYQDVGSGGTRDLVVQHLGDDATVGWLAFAARRPGDPRRCFLDWDAAAGDFVLTSATDDGCAAVRVDATGTGLLQYPVKIVDDEVRVDINFESDESEETKP